MTGLFEERPCNEDNNLLVIFFYKVKIRKKIEKASILLCYLFSCYSGGGDSGKGCLQKGQDVDCSNQRSIQSL